MMAAAHTGFGELTLTGLAASTLKRSSGMILLVLGLAIGVALIGFSSADPSLTHESAAQPANPLGAPGAIVADLLLQIFGLASVLLTVSFSLWGGRLVLNRPLPWPWAPVVALPISLLALSAFLAAQTVPDGETWPYRVGLGGFLGDYQLFNLQASIGADRYFWSTFVIALTASVVAIGVSWNEAVWLIKRAIKGARWFVSRILHASDWLAHRLPAIAGGRFAAIIEERRGQQARPDDHAAGGRWFDFHRSQGHGNDLTPESELAPLANIKLRRAQSVPVGDETDGKPATGARVSKPRPRAEIQQESLDLDQFHLPSLGHLAKTGNRSAVAPSSAKLKELSAELETVLDDFGVRGQIIGAQPGPVVTLFELEPAPGTRAARVISLADDIARSLCAMSVRVAVVPGRNVIGIELPNDKRETVLLRALLESDTFSESQARLALALGKDISGNPIIVDLARMPHLLIAGTTGSGKSVAINAMILSLLYRLTPEQCRIIMVDPKVIELSVYEDIPHLLAPVVTEPHKAVVALKWVVRQMDERYRLMSHLGVRDIFAYNRRLEQAGQRGEELMRRVRTGFEPGTGAPIYEEIPIEMTALPLIVVIVDEVADLMLTAGKEIEGAIQRLSQKARAAGIHLIVATQRPSVDVLTGVIKANLPSRISFRVSSKIDSRTILGEPGAEQLLGQGDMLYLMPGDRISRIHGPLVTDGEVEGVVEHLKSQGFPDYHDEITTEGGGEFAIDEVPAFDADTKDDLYNQAIQIIARDGKASTSYLQRKLSIGYNSAAKLIERMEVEGLISSADHVGRRQVLMGKGGVDGNQPTDV